MQSASCLNWVKILKFFNSSVSSFVKRGKCWNPPRWVKWVYRSLKTMLVAQYLACYICLSKAEGERGRRATKENKSPHIGKKSLNPPLKWFVSLGVHIGYLTTFFTTLLYSSFWQSLLFQASLSNSCTLVCQRLFLSVSYATYEWNHVSQHFLSYFT